MSRSVPRLCVKMCAFACQCGVKQLKTFSVALRTVQHKVRPHQFKSVGVWFHAGGELLKDEAGTEGKLGSLLKGEKSVWTPQSARPELCSSCACFQSIYETGERVRGRFTHPVRLLLSPGKRHSVHKILTPMDH